MCGIVGFLSASPSTNLHDSHNILHAMNNALSHRGPDDEGFFEQGRLMMGMKRLKIIDLETGKQPISNEDNTVSVVFNGEIYNYRELRAELMSLGHRFKTESDTEVIVHSYEEWGETFPRRFRGMFAFALWDHIRQRLLLGRDHFGIKPLYWGIMGGVLMFASEIKALRRHPSFNSELNYSAIDDFLTLLFIPTPQTAYRHVFKLEPASVLIIDSDLSHRTIYFWDPILAFREARCHPIGSLADMKKQLEIKLAECVKLVLRSDVPLGVFLSSGLDSTTIASFAVKVQKDIRTFTIFYDDESYSEHKEARLVAQRLGTYHQEIPLEFPNDLPQFVWNVLSMFDQPFGDLSSIPTYLLCQAARQHITVALSGDGGDELFAGYPTTLATKAFGRYRRIPPFFRDKIFPRIVDMWPTNFDRITWDYKLKRFVHGSIGLHSAIESHFAWRGAFTWSQRPDIYRNEFFDQMKHKPPYASAIERTKGMEDIDLDNRCLLTDLRVNLLDQYLIKADMTSMAHSLELRPALLDPELAELSFRIPFEYKLRGHTTKWILRSLMKQVLPEEVVSLPKKGFTPPLSYWLSEVRFQKFIHDAFSQDSFTSLQIFKPGVVESLLKEHREKKVDHTRRLWAMLSLATFASQG